MSQIFFIKVNKVLEIAQLSRLRKENISAVLYEVYEQKTNLAIFIIHVTINISDTTLKLTRVLLRELKFKDSSEGQNFNELYFVRSWNAFSPSTSNAIIIPVTEGSILIIL